MNGTVGLRVATVQAVVALALLLGCSIVALGQAQNTGTISGNVKDSQSKVVVGAEITLFNTATSAKRVEHSNAEGEYLFSDVAVGDYVLTVTSPGFGTTEVDSLHVDADANVRTDLELRPASVNQEVTVESQGTTLDTRSATLGTLIDQKEVDNLPIDGNNTVSLAALLPGVSNVNAPTTFTSDTGGPTYNISGSRNNQNLFLLDGQLWNNLFYNTGLNFPPAQTLQEISILLNNYKAQYGRNVGSIMNVLTRSGSNTMHGSLVGVCAEQGVQRGRLHLAGESPPGAEPVWRDHRRTDQAGQDLLLPRSAGPAGGAGGLLVGGVADAAGARLGCCPHLLRQRIPQADAHMCQYPGIHRDAVRQLRHRLSGVAAQSAEYECSLDGAVLQPVPEKSAGEFDLCRGVHLADGRRVAAGRQCGAFSLLYRAVRTLCHAWHRTDLLQELSAI